MLSLITCVLLSAAPTEAGRVCVPQTKVCAEAGSKLEGRGSPYGGGAFTLTPKGPLEVFGGRFRGGAPLIVNVVPWGSSDGRRGAVVSVTGELDGRQVISGVGVSGPVVVAQADGAAQLVVAQRVEPGRLALFGGEQVTLEGPAALSGSLDLGGGTIELTSSAPMTLRGIVFVEGSPLRVRRSADELRVTGRVRDSQTVGGLPLSGDVEVSFLRNAVKLHRASPNRTVELALFGLPPGKLPAGAEVIETPAETLVLGDAGVVVCGVALGPHEDYPGRRQVVFTRDPGTRAWTVRGAFAEPTTSPEGGPAVKGAGGVNLPPEGCEGLGVFGTTVNGQRLHGLKLAAGTAFDARRFEGAELVRATLDGPQRVGDRTLTGELVAKFANDSVELLRGTLAAPSRHEAWQLPAGTELEVWKTGFHFETKDGRSASALASHRGLKVDHVADAYVDETRSTFLLTAPLNLPGTDLRVDNLSIDADGGCITAGAAVAQKDGLLQLPANFGLTTCGGELVSATGDFAVPNLRFGRYFGTSLVAGSADSPPPELNPMLGQPQKRSSRATGFWLQTNSLCQGPSGIPQPPPPQHWVFLDRKGEPVREKDRQDLDAHAVRKGAPCPEMGRVPVP